ncbi:MAG TPA: alpha/beta hydrolase [Candidatus Acidoferrales bacterium]|nr:alpha/beta hydrolase [Candidatus Acidoferrales bacterium]
MSVWQRGEVSIYYETYGSGFPLLLIAPGGMNSVIEFWNRSAFNPMEIFSKQYWCIAMDQRNAGRSKGPLEMEDPWGSYAGDQLGLMNHLGIERFHVLGCCIGCSYALSLIQRAPKRVVAAVLEQPIGISDENRNVLATNLYGRWAKALPEKRPELEPAAVEAFGKRMFAANDFVFSVTREFVKKCRTPLLVMPGNNLDHPRAIGHEIAALAPNAEMIPEWREPSDLVPPAVARIKSFLGAHTPSS